jgi:hypothetical protein
MTREEYRMVLVDPMMLEDDVLLALLRDIYSHQQFTRVEIYVVFLVGSGNRYAFMLILEPEEKLERGFITRIGKHYYAFVEPLENSDEYFGFFGEDVKPKKRVKVYYADDKETLHEMLRDEGIEK